MSEALVNKITMLEFKQELKEHLNNVTEVLNEAKEEIIRLTKENTDLKAYNEKLLNGDIEKHNKIMELETELAKRAEQIEALNKDKDYFSDALDKQIEATYKVVEENNELKRECRRCIHTDCPCILSDYGKDRNGICDHFKDVFDENAELKVSCKIQVDTAFQMIYEKDEQLTEAKNIIQDLLSNSDEYARQRAIAFLKEE